MGEGGFRQYADDELALTGSFNTFNGTWLRKIVPSSQVGTKRELSDASLPVNKKAKIGAVSNADTMSVASSNLTLVDKIPQCKAPTNKQTWNFSLLVPLTHFSKTELLFYQLPKFYHRRLGKWTNKCKLRSHIPGGKPCWFNTIESIKTP